MIFYCDKRKHKKRTEAAFLCSLIQKLLVENICLLQSLNKNITQDDGDDFT